LDIGEDAEQRTRPARQTHALGKTGRPARRAGIGPFVFNRSARVDGVVPTDSTSVPNPGQTQIGRGVPPAEGWGPSDFGSGRLPDGRARDGSRLSLHPPS